MYLVSSPDHFHKKTTTTKQLAQLPTTTCIKNKNANHKLAPRHKRQKKKRRISKKLHPYYKWIMTRKKIEEPDVRREALMKETAKLLEEYCLNIRRRFNNNYPLQKKNP